MAKKQHVMSLLILSSLILGLTGCTETVAHKQEPSHKTTIEKKSMTKLEVEESTKKLLVNSMGVNVKLELNEKEPSDFTIEGKKSLIQTYDDENQLAVVLTQTDKKANDFVKITVGQDLLKKVIVDVKDGNFETTGQLESESLAITAKRSQLVFNEPLKANSILLKLEESNLEGTNLEAKNAEFVANQGSFQFEKVHSDSVKAELVRGNFITKETKGKLDLAAEQGDIKVGNVTGSAFVHLTDGSMIGNFKEVTDNLSMVIEKGHIKVLLPETLAFRFKGVTDKGTLKTDFDEQLKSHEGVATGKVNDNPKVNITVEAKGGSVELSRPETIMKKENKHAKNN